MPIIESRVKNGDLTFTPEGTPGTPVSFSCQATNVRVTPSYSDDGDAVETLCAESIPAGKKETWQIQGTVIQDFDEPAGFLAFCYENAMQTVPFEWVPNDTGAPTWSGECVIVALEEGGDVNSRLTVDFAFDCAGKPARGTGTPPATMAAAQREPTLV